MSVKSLAETVSVCVSGIKGEDGGGGGVCRRQEQSNRGDDVGEGEECGRINEGGNADE